MLKRPRKNLLDMTAGWDLDVLSGDQLQSILSSSFIFMVFIVENCGFWDGDTPYHSSATVFDESHVIFGYVLF